MGQRIQDNERQGGDEWRGGWRSPGQGDDNGGRWSGQGSGGQGHWGGQGGEYGQSRSQYGQGSYAAQGGFRGQPGFGGQSYIPTSTAKIRRARHMLDAAGSLAELEVDGGVTPQNAAEIVAAGATILVAGSAIFGGPNSAGDVVAAFRDALGL